MDSIIRLVENMSHMTYMNHETNAFDMDENDSMYEEDDKEMTDEDIGEGDEEWESGDDGLEKEEEEEAM